MIFISIFFEKYFLWFLLNFYTRSYNFLQRDSARASHGIFQPFTGRRNYHKVGLGFSVGL